MNLVDRTFESLFSRSSLRSAGPLSGWPFFGYNNAVTKNGKKVNVDTSLKISAFWCGVNNIANSVAMLPKHIMIKNGESRTPDTSHPVDYIMHNRPNKHMTAFTFWFVFAVWTIVRGKGYALIIRDGGGRVVQMQLWQPNQVTPMMHDGELYYRHSDYKLPFHSSEVFHVPNFSFNGIDGRGVIEYAADNLGVSLGAEEFAGQVYDNKGVSHGILETDLRLNENGKKNLIKLTSQSLNVNDKHRLAVFDEGMKYKRISLTPAESEFIAAKAQGVEDIARWLNIPLHKLHTKGEGGYNFLVQMSIEYLQSSVLPLAQKIKEEAESKLLSPSDRAAGRYVFMNYRKLLEVDPKARTQYYKDMVFIKSMTPNEVRRLEDMNPVEGGDEVLQMSNLQTQKQIEKMMES